MTTMLASFDFNELTPLVILSVLFLLVASEIFSGLRTGKMDEHLRRGSGPESNDEINTRETNKKEEPWNFRILFVFYVLVATLVPAMMIVALLNKTGIIAWPYN